MQFNLYAWIATLGVVIVLVVGIGATSNLQELKFKEIKLEAEAGYMLSEIIALGETKASINTMGDLDEDTKKKKIESIDEKIELMNTKLNGSRQELGYNHSRTRSFIQAGILLLFIGLVIAVSGVYLWYFRVQRYVDAKLKRKLK